MIRVYNWVDRKFDLNLPVWMWQNLLERLRGTPARVEDRVRAWPRELLTRRVNDKWSVQERVGHLLDVEPLWWGRLDDFDAGAETLRPADMSNLKSVEANHNAASLEQLFKDFRAARAAFVRRIENYDEAAALRTGLHPRLKTPIRVIDHITFVCEHDDHELAKMAETISILHEQ
jgi:uncharacterized damage-inducible protein DinB